MAKTTPQNNRPQLTRLIAVLLSCTLPMSGLAQTEKTLDDANSNGQKAPAEKQEVAPEKKETVKPALESQGNSSKRFTPSESISEDLSVAFPIDI